MYADMKILRYLFCIMFIMFFSITFVSASAASDAVCILKIDGMQVQTLSVGEVSATLNFKAEKSEEAILCGAIYEEDILTDIVIVSENLYIGENTLELSNLSTTERSTELRFMLWNSETLIPLMNVISFSDEYVPDPYIEEFAVNIVGTYKNGQESVTTYNGLIDQTEKVVYINVPVLINSDGTLNDAKQKGGIYDGAPSESEFTESIKNLSPDVICSDGAHVIGGTDNLDFTDGRELTIADKQGRQSVYNVKISAYTVQRDINFVSSSKYLVTPATANYGTNVYRHGAPGPSGTRAGGGIWMLENFEYQKDDNDEYIIDSVKSDDKTGYVRTAESPAYLDVSDNNFLRLVKDKNGSFSMYSTAGAASGFSVLETYGEIKVNIENISNRGIFDICFGENRFIARAVENGDGKTCSVWFGWDGEDDENTLDEEFHGIDSGIDIDINADYAFKCITIKSDDGSAKGVLFVNGNRVASAEMRSPYDIYKLETSHVRLRPYSSTLCSIKIYEWMLWYIKIIPQRIYEVYDGVATEERDIWLWIATMYDGNGTISYSDGVDTEHLKYDSMNYINGGSGNGFFYAPSSKANPGQFCAEIESTGLVLGNMSSVGLLKYMPQNIRDRFYQYFASRYRNDSDTPFGAGYYDTLYADTVNSRGHSRNQSNAKKMDRVKSSAAGSTYKTSTMAVIGDKANVNDAVDLQMDLLTEDVDMLAQQTIYESEDSAVNLLSGSQWTDLTTMGQATAANMVQAIQAGPAAFRNWIEHLAWNTHSWTAGDLLSNTPVYIEKYSANMTEQAAYYHEALDYLVTNQNEDGTWWKEGGKEKIYGIEVSGIYKICLFLAAVPDEILNSDSTWNAFGYNAVNWMPRSQQIYDYILNNLRNYDTIASKNWTVYGMTSTLMVRNTLDVIYSIRSLINDNKLELDLPFIIDFSYKFMLLFKIDSGEYASSITYDSNGNITQKISPASTGMGYSQGLGFSEGCINTCTSITKLYTYLSGFYNLVRPSFDEEFAEKFYGIMQDELDNHTWEKIYEDKYSITDQSLSEDFEDCELGNLMSGELSDSIFTYTAKETSSVEVITDNDKTSKVLKFSFDTTEDSSGAAISFKNNMFSNISLGTAVLEFDIKFDPGSVNNANNIFHFGFTNAVLFSTKTDGDNLKIVTRTAADKIGSTNYKTLNPNTWYTVKLVYSPSAAEIIQLYIDENLVYSGNDYYGSESGKTAVGSISLFSINYYKNTTAVIYIDNVNIHASKKVS